MINLFFFLASLDTLGINEGIIGGTDNGTVYEKELHVLWLISIIIIYVCSTKILIKLKRKTPNPPS